MIKKYFETTINYNNKNKKLVKNYNLSLIGISKFLTL